MEVLSLRESVMGHLIQMPANEKQFFLPSLLLEPLAEFVQQRIFLQFHLLGGIVVLAPCGIPFLFQLANLALQFKFRRQIWCAPRFFSRLLDLKVKLVERGFQ